ncbi:hypothetical protein [endosymbiont DhMRE of Dentiscutata heterogama]|uniref:hypothetical protein n=1 Tax=endosymbiont DhMRE of Dentiscutata heterogama TaxID=1609546 RepID=UPI002AD49FDF|nr:hypothetical protein [endosymbiont DhMRE of Dentiscutata heterogama]
MIWIGKPKFPIKEEKYRYCPNCDIKVRKGGFTYDRFIHDIYKMMYPCVLQWDQLSPLPRKANYYDRNY